MKTQLYIFALATAIGARIRRASLCINLFLVLFGALLGSVSTANGALGPYTVIGWGDNVDGDGQTVNEATPPAGLTNVAAIAAGGSQGLVLNLDGSVAGWGDPVAAPPILSNVVSVAAGYQHDLALKSDGTVVAWGYDGVGQTDVPTGLTNVVAIAADGCECGVGSENGGHSTALRSDGTVVDWGISIAAVPDGVSNVVAISAGIAFGLALQTNGLVTGWGHNVNGQATSPLGLSNVVAIATGGAHSLALVAGGTVRAWGNNFYGQAQVPPGLSNVVAIAAGEDLSLALQSNGHVTAWGRDIAGETTPPVGLSNVVAISAGWAFCLALTNNGSPFFVNQMPNRSLYSESSSVMNFDGVKWQLFCPAQNVFAGSTVALNATVVSQSAVSMQWQFAGTNIPGATNSVLIVTNVQPITQGSYTLSTSNGAGTTTTPAANFSVTFINAQPSSQTVLDGHSAMFSVGTVPTSDPYTYYWYYENTNLIESGTNSTFEISSVSTNDAGQYSVVVSNIYGSVTSAVASLTVVPATPPQIISTDAQFGFVADGFGFNIRGALGQTIVVEGSSDFVSWTPLMTNLITDTNFFYFSDADSINFQSRFYRAKLP